MILKGATVLTAEESAFTDNWKYDSNDRPISASTTFFQPWIDCYDLDRTSHHELLHGLGFSYNSKLFKKHVNTTTFEFCAKDDATGKALGKLVKSYKSTHLDDEAGKVNGFEQSDSVMSPYYIVSQRMGDQEKQILDAALGWSGRNLQITIEFANDFTAEQKTSVTNAINAAMKLFNSDKTGHKFLWKVRVKGGSASADQPPSEAR